MTIPDADRNLTCSSCGARNPPQFPYCVECGCALAAAHQPTGTAMRAPRVPEPRPSAVPPPPPPAPPSSAPAAPDGDGYESASILLGPAAPPAAAPPGPPAPGGVLPTRPGPPPGAVAAPPSGPEVAFAAPPPPPVFPPPGQGGHITVAGLVGSHGMPARDLGPPLPGPAPRPGPVPRTIPVTPGQWSVGELVAGRFVVHRKIVSGMGVVYLCYDQQAAEPIAIKTYLDSLAGGPGRSDSEFAQLFESEALLWIRLGRHPHVVQARYVLRFGGKPHIFLEYVPGPTGGESTVRRLLRAGRVDVPTALLLAIQVCAGMEHATRVFPGFVHRDLKPENLLLTADHVLKITDFGLTKVFADFSGDVGVVAGTPPYMSPEQCLGLPSLDTRSDVYALGVILYELLTGRRPFAGRDVGAYLRAHLIEPPTPPRQHVPQLPEAVERLVLRCLEKSPEARFPDFSTLRAELTACYRAATGQEPALPSADDAAEENAAALAGVELARAISLVTLGRYEEAMTFFDLAVEHDPTLTRAWVFRGLALNGLGRFEEALACLDRVVSLDPRDGHAWVEKGRALTRGGRREEALGCFDRAIAINPWNATALYEKGACLLFLGRFGEAAACIGEVAGLRPGPAVEAARQACLASLDAARLPAGLDSRIGSKWRPAAPGDTVPPPRPRPPEPPRPPAPSPPPPPWQQTPTVPPAPLSPSPPPPRPPTPTATPPPARPPDATIDPDDGLDLRT